MGQALLLCVALPLALRDAAGERVKGFEYVMVVRELEEGEPLKEVVKEAQMEAELQLVAVGDCDGRELLEPLPLPQKLAESVEKGVSEKMDVPLIESVPEAPFEGEGASVLEVLPQAVPERVEEGLAEEQGEDDKMGDGDADAVKQGVAELLPLPEDSSEEE